MSKEVTIMAFGPSRNTCQDPPIGEIWSLNACWQVFGKEIMDKVTCIYDMHQLSKRDKEVYNGEPYLPALNEWGKKGKRIVLIAQDDRIANSETYPLFDIERRFGVRLWSQTPTYMIARAIYEDFKHIRLIGVDNGDWKHSLGREAMAFFLGFAMARGIKVSGSLPIIERHHKRYGYDYGPEWDDYQNEMLWGPFPFLMNMKGDWTPCPAGLGEPIIE